MRDRVAWSGEPDRERDRERDGLFETNRSFMSTDKERDRERDFEERAPADPERDLERPLETDLSDLTLWERFLIFFSPRPSSLPDACPAIASRSALVLGAKPSVSSRTSRFVNRGKMVSHTRSSVKSWSTNSSMNVSW